MSAATVDCAAVDFDLSGDQQALRDAAVSLLDKMAGSDALRARVGTGRDRRDPPGRRVPHPVTAADAPTGYDDAVWSAMAEQGWLAIELPEDEGGLGLGMVELAVLCEEIGRRLVAAPFLPTIVALGALCGDEARADKPGRRNGARRWGWATPWGAWPPHRGPSGLTVSGSEGQVRLSGQTPPVAYAPSADVAVVLAGKGVYGSTCAPRDAQHRCRPWTARASSAS